MNKTAFLGFTFSTLLVGSIYADSYQINAPMPSSSYQYNYGDQPSQYSNNPQPLNANYQYSNTVPQNSYQYSSTNPNLYLDHQSSTYQYDDRPNQWYSDRHYNYGNNATPFANQGNFIETDVQYGTVPVDHSVTNQTRVHETPQTTIQHGTTNATQHGTTTTQYGSSQQALANSGIDLANKIRKALQVDTTLSSNARNVQVGVDSNGNVTLKGTVASDAEKNKVEAIARGASGQNNITNKLTILKK